MNATASHGFTLIELMIAITLFAILSLLAMPLYSQFMANTQIRTAAESVLAGLRVAQTEAVKRNGNVEFALDETKGWTVTDRTDAEKPEPVSEAQFMVGASKAQVIPSGAPRRVTFNGLGRIVPTNADGTKPIDRIDVTTSLIADPRKLQVIVGPGGVRLCDPKFGPTDPAGCPAEAN